MATCRICKRHAGGWCNKKIPQTIAIEAGGATGGGHRAGEDGAALGACSPSVQRARGGAGTQDADERRGDAGICTL
jgi:hypothetical protein